MANATQLQSTSLVQQEVRALASVDEKHHFRRYVSRRWTPAGGHFKCVHHVSASCMTRSTLRSAVRNGRRDCAAHCSRKGRKTRPLGEKGAELVYIRALRSICYAQTKNSRNLGLRSANGGFEVCEAKPKTAHAHSRLHQDYFCANKKVFRGTTLKFYPAPKPEKTRMPNPNFGCRSNVVYL